MESGYPVLCKCGRTHRVSAGAAGTRFPCGCGREVAVPTLRRLREAAGEPTLSAELEIQAKLQAGELSAEDECLSCGSVTTDVRHLLVVCERIEVRRGGRGPWLVWLLLGPFWGLLGLLMATREPDRELGRNVSFRLPLRVCSDCAPRLRASRARELMRQVPVYARLLDKYPHAEVRVDRD